MNSKITQWLQNQHQVVFSLYTTLVAFSTYACMYAFRKPFTVAAFEGVNLWGLELKTVFIISQIFGYTLSKFMGIKVVSEMTPQKRARTILFLIGLAEIALLLFWLSPLPYKVLFIFFNGLPLGMVWGLVFAYLEGRKNTELLGAGL